MRCVLSEDFTGCLSALCGFTFCHLLCLQFAIAPVVPVPELVEFVATVLEPLDELRAANHLQAEP
jgi:hypothetical protein